MPDLERSCSPPSAYMTKPSARARRARTRLRSVERAVVVVEVFPPGATRRSHPLLQRRVLALAEAPAGRSPLWFACWSARRAWRSPRRAFRSQTAGTRTHALFPHSPCSVVPVLQLACPAHKLTRLSRFCNKRQREGGSWAAQVAGPPPADGGYRDTETKQRQCASAPAASTLGPGLRHQLCP
jgi:hypothetical protein